MKVVILHYAAPPIIGGVERVIYFHAVHLAQTGHDVHVIAGRGAAFDPRVTFHHFPLADSRQPEILELKAQLDTGRLPVTQFETMVGRIYEELLPLVQDADVVIAHNVLGLHKNLALTAALYRFVRNGQSPRFIAWQHDLAWKSARYVDEMFDGYPWDLLRQPWERTRYVAVSVARRRDMTEVFQMPPEKIAVVPGGVDTYTFQDLTEETQQIIETLNLMPAYPVLLLPARITRRKNIELALQVIAQIRDRHFPEVALVITGPPGPHNPANRGYFDQLQDLRAELELLEHVHFLAEQIGDGPDDRTMASLYRFADALLFPSREEGFGLPILEAALARLPIFCADIEPLRELAGGRANYFSPDEEPMAIADLIGQVLSADRAAMLRKHVVSRYDWKSIVQQQVEPLLHEPL